MAVAAPLSLAGGSGESSQAGASGAQGRRHTGEARPGFCLGGIDIGGWEQPSPQISTKPGGTCYKVSVSRAGRGGARRGRPCRSTCSWACVFCCFDTSAIVGSSLQGNMHHPSHPPFALPEGEVPAPWVTPPPLLLRSLGHSVLPEASGTSLLAFPVVQLQSAVVSIS